MKTSPKRGWEAAEGRFIYAIVEVVLAKILTGRLRRKQGRDLRAEQEDSWSKVLGSVPTLRMVGSGQWACDFACRACSVDCTNHLHGRNTWSLSPGI